MTTAVEYVDQMDGDLMAAILDNLLALGVEVGEPDLEELTTSDDPVEALNVQMRASLKAATENHPVETAQATFLVIFEEDPVLALSILFA